MVKSILKVSGAFKEAYLNTLMRVKLLDRETAFSHV